MGEILLFKFCPKTALMYMWAHTSRYSFLERDTQMNETYENEEKHD